MKQKLDTKANNMIVQAKKTILYMKNIGVTIGNSHYLHVAIV